MVGYGAFLAAVTCIMMLYYTYIAFRAQETADWPSTEGMVLEATNRTRFLGRASSMRVYYPKVAYRYRVNGIEYRSHRHDFEGLHYPGDYIGRYKVGSTVQVYYNPDDPSAAVIHPGTKRGWFKILIGLPFILVVYACIVCGAVIFKVRRDSTGVAVDHHPPPQELPGGGDDDESFVDEATKGEER